MTHSENGFIEGYSINPSNGVLTRLPGSPWTVGYRLFGCDIAPDGSKIMAARLDASGGNRPGDVSTFPIDPETGSLGTRIVTSGVSGSPTRVYISPNGLFAYLAYSSTPGFRGFLLDGLSQIGNFSASIGVDMGFSKDGAALYVVDHLSNMQTFLLDQVTGLPTRVQVLNPIGQYGVTVSPDGRHLYTCDVNPSKIDALAINPSDHTLTPVAGSPFLLPSNLGPSNGIFSSDGRYLYVLTLEGLSTFSRDVNTGVITQLRSNPLNSLARNQALTY